MATAPSPPILNYTPGGGVPVGPISSPPVYSQADITQLVIGQAYVDVVFGSIQTSEDWVLVECVVTNEVDLSPLNIWPGIITDRTAAGFRLQLNGMPDSWNYYLHWAVSGVNITPSPASTYLLTGPTSGNFGVDATFTVKLPPSTTVSGTLTVTPNDGGSGGVFSPTSVTLSTTSATATFTYSAASYGAKTISVTNSGTLTDPAAIVYTVTAPTYAFSGPSTGGTGVPSDPFTVTFALEDTLPAPVTVTPNDGGAGGTFAPTSVVISTGSLPQHFTYTAASSGAKTISVTNSGGLPNPASLVYTASIPLVSTWHDSSGNGHDATQTGSARPTLIGGVVNGKPVVRFASASSQFLSIASTLSADLYWVSFVVMKPTGLGIVLASINSSNSFPCGPLENSDSKVYVSNKVNFSPFTNSWSAAFHVFSGTSGDIGIEPKMYVDGTLQTGLSPGGGSFAGDFNQLASTTSNGDIAEIIHYSTTVSLRLKLVALMTLLLVTGEFPSEAELDLMVGDRARIKHYLHQHGAHPTNTQLDEVVAVEPLTVGDRAGIEKYLGTKYGITVAGGTAVDPLTVTGLAAWWKADAL